ncbi:MAG: ROK family transcriptional regulator [Pseudomonadota bacterium]
MRGGDTSALRAFNERLIIGAIRQHGPLSKAELARATGLSAQAASTIVNALVGDQLLVKQPKVRGQVGQPYTPMALAPDGAFSLGVKIGRGSVEAVLVDFVGGVVANREGRFEAPLADIAMPMAVDCARAVLGTASRKVRSRIAGVGIAMPGDLPAWSVELGLAPGALEGWRSLDVAAAMHVGTDLPAEVYNDATAACAAEMALGDTLGGGSALYLYLGTFAGGGLVLDGRLFRGSRGNAAAVGSMPMAVADEDGRPLQLLHEASVAVLERRLAPLGVAGIDGLAADDGPPVVAAVVERWIAEAGRALARTMIATAAVLDIETVVLDGLLGRRHLERLAAATEAALEGFNTKGLSPFTLRLGSVGRSARVLGAALLPLSQRYSADPDALVAGPREKAAATTA